MDSLVNLTVTELEQELSTLRAAVFCVRKANCAPRAEMEREYYYRAAAALCEQLMNSFDSFKVGLHSSMSDLLASAEVAAAERKALKRNA